MPDTESSTNNFLMAIEKYANEQRNQIKLESENFKKAELAKAEEEGLKEAYNLIQREMANIRAQISSELSREEMASKVKLFEKRNKIADEVFAKVSDKLIAFTKTDDYVKMLEESVKKIAEYINADDTVFYVKKDDIKYTDNIKSAFGGSCTVIESKSIKLGGVTGRSSKLGLIADETLDTKLEGQREWFYKNSDLKVTE